MVVFLLQKIWDGLDQKWTIKIANFRDYFDHNYTNFCQVIGLEPALKNADPKLNYIETRKIVKAFNLVVERSDVCWSL